MPIDQLADELKNAMLLPEDADSSTLVEMLKDKRRPSRRRSGRKINFIGKLWQDGVRQRFDNAQTVVVTGKEIFNANRPFPEKMAERRNAIIAWLEQKGWLKSFTNTDTGWEIAVSRGSIRDTSAYGLNDGKAQVLAALPDIIQNGIYVDEGVAKKPGHKRYIFASKVKVGEIGYVVGFVVDEDQNGKRFYNHELTEIENLDKPSLDRLPKDNVTEVGQGLPVLGVIKNKLGVNAATLFQTAYHGSARKVKKLSTKYVGTGLGAQSFGWGLYFAGDKETSEYYRNRVRKGRSSGQLFEVDIPENDVLLDHDKFASEQPEVVKSALRKLGLKIDPEDIYDWPNRRYLTANEKGKISLTMQEELQKDGYTSRGGLLRADCLSGSQLYTIIAEEKGSPRAASEALNEAGVKGITYETGRDGRCFVVFDDKAIKVLKTYYQGMEQTADEAFASGTEAMERVITQQTDVLDAMFRPDVGSISFYWGNPGKGKKFKHGSGVSHLIAHRNAQGLDGEAIARKMPEVLAYGKVSGSAMGGDRVFISHDNHTAILSLYRFGNRETWLVSGWLDDKPSDAQAKVYDSAEATNTEATRFHSDAGAESEIPIPPLGVDGKPLFHDIPSGVPNPRPMSAADIARGFVTIANGQEYTIQLLKKANLSTILHETGHIALLEMNRLVTRAC